MLSPTGSVTPMMAQFLEIKAEYPDALLFYRMGDFYEMFFEDAVQAAAALDIALTKRGKHLGKDIPMCGVPVHSAEGYFLTLIRKEFRVAVCEQLENPAEAKKRGAKSVVKRGVVRVVTPGTLTEESLLQPRQHNFLCAYAQVRGDAALAWTDVSTGDLFVSHCEDSSLAPLLARLSAREVLVSQSLQDQIEPLVNDAGAALTPLSGSSFDSHSAVRRLCEVFKVASLDGYGSFTRPQLSALGAIVDYLAITQQGNLPLLRPPVQETHTDQVQIDAATRRNLEITNSLSGDKKGSLIATIDHTTTGAGARLLEQRLSGPTTRADILENRLDGLGFFYENPEVGADVRDLLRQCPDMDRALTRLSLNRAGPRDLVAIRQGLKQGEVIAALLKEHAPPRDLSRSGDALTGQAVLWELLQFAVVNEPPLLLRDGGFVASGFHAKLDAQRELRDRGRQVISTMQGQYAQTAGVTSLKIKHNNVLGYFIETPATHANKMLSEPLNETFIHRQTTANSVRFTTTELSDMQSRILNAGGQAMEIEKQVFEQLRDKIVQSGPQVYAAARALAEIDVALSLADLARAENWTRPKLTNDRKFVIAGGRHPVVEAALKKEGSSAFIANDCDLSAAGDKSQPIWLLTGPNMAGKSTFLRQNALIVLLAQMGSYVPARSAEIGLVSQIFSRVGASDDLARGRSTFMVEMVETAAILNQAGPDALVILDEIGRGTATYDGLSIAWATLEHLHDVNKCRCLFATHYHELTNLSKRLSGMANATVSVREWEGDVIFLHEVKKGVADRSYGVQVARLAGLPSSVVKRARIVLDALEKGEREGKGKPAATFEDLPLFSVPQAPPTNQGTNNSSPVASILGETLPDELTPKEALALVYELKALLNDSNDNG